jgi:hypothetical protein
VGALRVGWTNAQGVAPRIQTLALNRGQGAGAPRFGMLVDSQPAAAAAAAASVDFGAEQSQLFRADFGVVNLLPGPTQVRVTLKRAAGETIAQTVLNLQPRQHLERNVSGIFRDTAIGTGRNWTVETEVLAGGPVLTYLANINASGDIFFVPGRSRNPAP